MTLIIGLVIAAAIFWYFQTKRNLGTVSIDLKDENLCPGDTMEGENTKAR